MAIAVSALAVIVGAAAEPSVLSQIRSGMWEVSGKGGAPTARLCIAQTPLIAQIEHRTAKCSRTVVRDDSSLAVIEYSCAGAGFGHSEVTMLTPRSVRIATQGISDGIPFAYVVQARRVGDCPRH